METFQTILFDLSAIAFILWLGYCFWLASKKTKILLTSVFLLGGIIGIVFQLRGNLSDFSLSYTWMYAIPAWFAIFAVLSIAGLFATLTTYLWLLFHKSRVAPIVPRLQRVKRTGWWVFKQSVGFTILLFLPSVFLLFLISFGSADLDTHRGPANRTAFRDAHDLERATGIAFPDVTAVDSTEESAWRSRMTTVSFVPKRPLKRKFKAQLDEVCQTDKHWRKDEGCWHYNIEVGTSFENFDRKIKSHERVGSEAYISVSVPEKGDTIILYYGYTH